MKHLKKIHITDLKRVPRHRIQRAPLQTAFHLLLQTSTCSQSVLDWRIKLSSTPKLQLCPDSWTWGWSSEISQKSNENNNFSQLPSGWGGVIFLHFLHWLERARRGRKVGLFFSLSDSDQNVRTEGFPTKLKRKPISPKRCNSFFFSLQQLILANNYRGEIWLIFRGWFTFRWGPPRYWGMHHLSQIQPQKKTGPNPAQRDTDVGRKRRQTDWSRERGRVIQVFDSRSEPRIKIAPWQVAISVEFAEPLDQRRRRRRPILPVQFSLLSRFEAQTQNLKSIAQWHVTEISIGFDGSHDVPDKKW